MQYSAEAAGSAGQLHCHVIRRRFGDDGRAQYAITVGNETNDEANVFAFATDPRNANRHTVLRTTIGARSEFSTSAAFELPQTGSAPELRVVVRSGDIEFSLIVPGLETDFAERGVRPKSLTPRTTLPSVNGMYPAVPDPYAGPAPTRRLVYPAGTVARKPPGVVAMSSRSRKSPAVAPILLSFAGLLVAVVFTVLRPQSAVIVPPSAMPGSLVTIGYGATGIGAAAYSVLGAGGTAIAHGPLALGRGSFTLTLPPAHAAAQAYLVRVRVASVLGVALAEEYLRVIGAASAPAARPILPPRFTGLSQPATRPLKPPQIRSLALDRATLASGESLGVYYDVAATDGTIALTDPAAQITYGNAVVSASGRTTFVAPYVDAPRLLTVIVTAQRGHATTQSRIIVTVTPPTEALAPNMRLSTAGGDFAQSSISSSGTTISTPPTVRSQRPVRVVVHGATTQLAVALLDETGTEIARRDVLSGQLSVEFVAPAVRVATRFIFTATYARGQGSVTIVRNITVTP